MKNIIKLVIIILVIIVGLGMFFAYKKIKNNDYQWVCGSLHNHIMIFDNSEQNAKSLEEVIAASKELGMEFVMLSEKGPAYNENSEGWQNMIKECDENTTKNFVCLSGQENGTQEEVENKPRGHFVVIENKNYISELLNIQELFAETKKQESVVIIAHPFYKEEISNMYNYDRWDLSDWDAIEVINGVIDEEANEKALKKLYEFWNQGIQKSLTGGADFKNHKAYTDILLGQEEIEKNLETGYTCLYLENLNRESIIKAIKDGHGYASSGVQIKEFSINNAMMGETISALKGEFLNVKINLEARAKITKLLLIENGEILEKFEPNSNEFVENFSILAKTSNWYGLEVYADEGGKAFANAIWVEINN